jgi:hypothetical protein
MGLAAPVEGLGVVLVFAAEELEAGLPELAGDELAGDGVEGVEEGTGPGGLIGAEEVPAIWAATVALN